MVDIPFEIDLFPTTLETSLNNGAARVRQGGGRNQKPKHKVGASSQPSKKSKAASKVKWMTVCLPKSEGGLGLRRLQEWNKAAMGVRFWELASNHQSLWASWMRKKYLSKVSIWTISSKTTASSVWKSIIKAGTWVKVATQYVIFSGKTINLWSDPWFQGNGLQHLFQGPPLLSWGPPREVMLCTLFRDGKWHKPHRWPAEHASVWDDITELEIGGEGNDILIWTGSKSGKMSYSSAWEYIRKKGPQTTWAKELWRPIQPPSRSLLCWQAALDRLPTLQRLFSRQLIQNTTSYIWKATLKALGVSHVRQISLTDHFTWFISLGSTQTEKRILIKQKKVSEKEVSWEAPKEGWLKVNSDGSKSDDRFAYGALVADKIRCPHWPHLRKTSTQIMYFYPGA
ncbi:hypothetical protein QJS10_CPB12g01232 [Acorus calamus]|uniref:Reverse transcriptase zinc-binding domain-containing protein n=1 Tax=Acorus calamus TaxID=4465 RepID=A0AAV9DNY4_ACOCL|nr:hypothetical protein QJS10_CPB12g01232 [Acorus calamus]